MSKFAVYLIYTTLVLAVIDFDLSYGEIEATINHCCALGSTAAANSQHCNEISISTPVSGVPPETQSVCFSSMQLCCLNDLRTLHCEEGKEIARLGKTCPEDNTDQKLCCEACKLGMISASMAEECSDPDINFGCPWNSAYEACCSVNELQKFNSPTNVSVPTSSNHVSDNNICELYPGELCAHICVPVGGSFICRCHEGFTLISDGKTCLQNTAQNRCKTNNPCQHTCHDTGVAIACSCEKGYRLHANNKSCVDVDECLENLHYCRDYETCHNHPGGFYCEHTTDIDVRTSSVPVTTSASGNELQNCSSGFRPDKNTTKCVDINECDENIHVCLTKEQCVNLEGGYKCEKLRNEPKCNIGFKWDSASSTCTDINECIDIAGDRPCDSNQICENTVGSYRCRCNTGYQLDSLTQACVDINECQVDLHNCLPSQRCDNTIGSFQCVRYTNCGTGYTLNAQTGLCEDDDECNLKIDNCQSYLGRDYVCRNTPGSFRCDKKSKTDCDGGKCLAIKSQIQKCPRGFELNSTSHCEDINECEKGTAKCSSGQRCINIQGGYTCSNVLSCESGFKFNDARTRCIDVNECTELQRICDHVCVNMRGSYMCVCHPGYKLHDDNRTCVDINECDVFKDRRLCTGYCVNQPGSYSCQCPNGYVLGNDQASCQDIDECKDGTICSGPDKSCLNIRGSYRCNDISCPPGYVKDNQHNNRCKKSTNVCREEDIECIQQPIMYTFYFITLVSNYTIPPSGLELFNMRGPHRSTTTTVDFSLKLTMAHTPPGRVPATENYFLLSPSGHNQASIKLIDVLIGPQDIHLQLTMTFYHNGIYGGNAVSKIGLFVSQYEF